MGREAYFSFFSLLAAKCVLWLTHSGSIKLAVKPTLKHVYATSNREIILGHVPVAHSVIHVHESVLTSNVIQYNPDINSAQAASGSGNANLGLETEQPDHG